MDYPPTCDTCFVLDDDLFTRHTAETFVAAAKEGGLILAPHVHQLTPALNTEDVEKSARRGCKFCYLIQQAFSMLLISNEIPCVEIILRPYSAPVLATSHPRAAIEIYTSPTPASLDRVLSFIRNGPFSNDMRAKSALTSFLRSRDVPLKSDSEESFQFLEQCYSECIQTHTLCRKSQNASPKRLVDVSDSFFSFD